MYLFGFSLDNLSLMSLTIATGFVVDDAIVMIENIARYIEQGDAPLEAALKGSGADRLHHHFADRLADRGPDPAAVHGRRRRPPVPRIRDHAGHDHRALGGGFADARSDDVRADHAPSARASAQPPISVLAERGFNGSSTDTTACSIWVLDHQALTLVVALGTLVMTRPVYQFPRGSSRSRTPARFRVSRPRLRTFPLRRCPAGSRRWPRRS